MTKTIEQKFRKLNEVEHVLLRPGRYIGSVKPHEGEEWMPNPSSKKMEKRDITFNPGFIKLFDEVISNSVDHSKRPEGKHLDTIKVEVDPSNGEISIYDNGGIPVVIHKEQNQYVPEMIFELRAGSNFDDEDESVLTGQNGEGAGLTNIFSTKFVVETCDTKKKFKMIFEDNSQTRNPPKITNAEGSKGYTKISYIPDYEKLGMALDDGTYALDQDNYDMIYARVVEIAACNTHLKVYFNSDRIPTRSFKDYIEMFVGEDDYAYDEGEYFKVGVAPSDDGFQHISFVNTTRTKIGGTHILYVGMQIWEQIREHIKKKHRVDVKPSELRQHMTLFIDATIVNPRYSSQTKDDLITEVKEYKTTYEVSDRFINKIIKLPIIQNILDWAAAKQAAEDAKLARGAMKDLAKANPRRVDKFSDANEERDRHKCILFLTEGDSAAKAVQAGRGKSPYIGSMPLKGKPLNVREKEVLEILGMKKKGKAKPEDKDKKKEPNTIQKILTIMGLEIGVPVTNINQLRFGRVAFSTDADVDGAHICGLLINLFEKFWPELFAMGVINIFRTPLVKVTVKGKPTLEFFTEREFREWEQGEGKTTKGWSHKYYKGLGTSTAAEFTHYLANMDNYLFRIDIEDEEDKNAIDLAFSSSRADDRKVWLETPAANFEDFVLAS